MAQTNALLLPSLLFIRKVWVLVFAGCSSTCCRSYHQFSRYATYTKIRMYPSPNMLIMIIQNI
ncbi:hypothetical protein LINPERHAP1_LOCUS26637 [Linum perenne]